MRIANERRTKTRIGMTGGALVYGASGRQQVTLRNLSGSGVGVSMDYEPRPGEKVRVMLTLDGQTWLDLRGTVRHVQRLDGTYECGIDLRGSDMSALGQVEAYVSRASAAIAMRRQSRVYANRLRGSGAVEPPLAIPAPQPALEKPSSGQHRLVRDADGNLVTPGQRRSAAQSVAAAPVGMSEVGPTSSTREYSTLRPSTGKHRTQPQKAETKPRTRERPIASPNESLSKRRLAQLYRAAMDDLENEETKKKKKKKKS